jgi:hypothetical protein
MKKLNFNLETPNLGNPQKFNYEAVQIIHCKYVTLLNAHAYSKSSVI